MASVAGPRPAWVSTHPVPSSGARLSGPSGVQSHGFVVGDPASGRLVSTRPVSSPLVSAPSVRTRPSVPIRWWRLGTGPVRRGTRTTATGPGPGGLAGRAARVDDRAGPDAGDAAEVTQGRPGGRWRTRAGSGAGDGRA
jgi:hypothetical protein